MNLSTLLTIRDHEVRNTFIDTMAAHELRAALKELAERTCVRREGGRLYKKRKMAGETNHRRISIQKARNDDEEK